MKLVAALAKKPGQWMPVKTFSHAQNASIWARKVREGEFIAFRNATYEAQARGRTVYARLIE